MKQALFKISTSLMAFLVLFSTFSFTVDKHYCGDFLVDISYIGKADGCGMKMDSATILKKKNCCKNEVHKIQGQDELQQISDLKFDFKSQQFLIAFFVSNNNLLLDNQSRKINYKDFYPPDIPLDFQVSFQVFLI